MEDIQPVERDEIEPAVEEAPEPVKMRVGVTEEMVIINFARPVDLIGFTPRQARQLANDLCSRANLILHARHLGEAQARRERKAAARLARKERR